LRLSDLYYAAYLAYRQAGWLMGGRSPLAATLKLTQRCTLDCAHCPWSGNGPELSTDRWKEIMHELYGLGCRHLVLEGGEPTLRRDLQELILAAKAMGMKVTVATNGTRPLQSYTPDRFLVSVDGTRETHDALRGKGAYDRLIENLPTARAPRIALVSLSRLNVGLIEDVLAEFTPRLEGFWFSFVYDYGGRRELALSREEKKRAAGRIYSLIREYPIINKPSYLKNVGRRRPCHDWLLYTVTSDGKIHEGCMIEAVESCRCDECELACHREFSDLVEPRHYLSHVAGYLAGLLC